MPAFPPDFPDDFASDPFDGSDEFASTAPAGPVGAGRRAGPGAGARPGARANARAGSRARGGEGAHDGESVRESLVESDRDEPGSGGAGAPRPRRARARPSLKMQAIGYLSRREYSRQELRRKLLSWLRQRERDDAALAAAAQAAAREEAEALSDWPSNGIDDAFLPPRLQPAAPASRSARGGPAAVAIEEAFDGIDDDVAPSRATAGRHAPGDPAASALASLRRADGAPLPAALRQALAALAPEAAQAGDTVLAGQSSAQEPEAARLARLEREDPEAAVDQLLDWLCAQRYLSETRFVESRVKARSRKNGTAMIKHELARHGLALEPEQAAALRETEFARAHALWQRKFGEVTRDPRLRAKQARFLAARGFAADVVRRIVGGEEED